MSDTSYRDPYREAMEGIAVKVAMQAIRKIMRETKPDDAKLEQIISVVHSFEADLNRGDVREGT